MRMIEGFENEESEAPTPKNTPRPYVGSEPALQFLLETSFKGNKLPELLPFMVWVVPVPRTNYNCGTEAHKVFRVTDQSIAEWCELRSVPLPEKGPRDQICVCACVGRLVE